MGTIVVGYVPKPEGTAALRQGVEEAKLRNSRLVVVNSNRGGREMSDEDSVQSQAELDEIKQHLADPGVELEVRQFCSGMDPTGSLTDISP